MMTVVAIMAGLLPIMEHRHRLLDHGAHRGADDRRDNFATLLSLIVIPAIFGLIKGFRLPAKTDLTRSPRHSRPSQSSWPGQLPNRSDEGGSYSGA